MTLSRSVVLAVGALIVIGALVSCTSLTGTLQSGSRDYLVGWFQMQDGRTIIPVLKLAGSYYSVCFPGIEVPLKECPAGLEWALTPSSMEGTKIAFDKNSNAYSIIIVDREAMHFTDSGDPKWQPLTKVDKPSGLLNAEATPPRTIDDFIGWYQILWLPFLRYEIHKDGERYIAEGQMVDNEGLWKPVDKPCELTPLPNGLGFTMPRVVDLKQEFTFVYNEALKRFELGWKDTEHQSSVIKMPLARIPAPPSPEADAVPLPTVRIGIPTWH